MICKAEGPGIITYHWLNSATKDGRKDPVKESGSVNIDSGVLEFVRLGQKHWGYYTCQVYSDEKCVINSHTVQVSAVPQTRKLNGGYQLYQ